MRTWLVFALFACAACDSCKRGPRAEPERTALEGTASGRPFRLLIERDGKALAAVLQVGDEPPLQLAGEAAAPRIAVAEPGVKGDQVARIEGVLAPDGKLDAKLFARDGSATPLAGSPLRAQASDVDRWFGGTIGDAEVRAHLAVKAGAISGELYWQSDVSAPEALRGTLSPQTEAIAAELKSGHLGAILLSPALVAGDLASPDRMQSRPVLLQAAQTSPPEVNLGHGIRVIAHGRFARLQPGCTFDLLWPAIVGLPAPLGERADADLRQAAIGENDGPLRCERPDGAPPRSEMSTYAVGAFSSRAVAFELHHAGYSGGAHGSATTTCVVADLEQGLTVEPGKLIARREALSALITSALQAKIGATDLTAAGFNQKTAPTENVQICLRAGKAVILYNTLAAGPHSLGTPAVEVPTRQLAPLLVHNRALDSLLR